MFFLGDDAAIRQNRKKEKSKKPDVHNPEVQITTKINADLKRTKKPTIFFSLPLELRQSILLKTFETRSYFTLTLLVGENPIHNYHLGPNGQVQEPSIAIQQWYEVLCTVHPALWEDLVYVKEQWDNDTTNVIPREHLDAFDTANYVVVVKERLPCSKTGGTNMYWTVKR